MNGGEPDITGGGPILSIVFQIGQKRQNPGGIQINQVEYRNGLFSLLLNKAEQQNDAVAITMDGVGTCSSEAG